MTTIPAANIIKVDFGFAARARATLAADDTESLPAGQLVSYWDQANALKESVVISGPDRNGFQRYVSEDGGESTLSGFGLAEKPPGHAGWQLVRAHDGSPRVLSPDEIVAFVDRARVTKDAAARERAVAEAQKKRDHAAASAALLAEFSDLENAATAKTQGCILAARNIRTRLCCEFPKNKFSVTTSRFAGGTSVRIHWHDGPTTESVDAIVGRFQTEDFDGMDDSSHFRHDVWTELFGGSRFVQTSRTISPVNYRKVADEIALSGVTVTDDGQVNAAQYEDRETLLRVASGRAFD